jgi:hypothetical protein
MNRLSFVFYLVGVISIATPMVPLYAADKDVGWVAYCGQLIVDKCIAIASGATKKAFTCAYECAYEHKGKLALGVILVCVVPYCAYQIANPSADDEDEDDLFE